MFKQARPVVIDTLIGLSLALLCTSASAQTPSSTMQLPPGHPDMQQPSPQSVAAEGVRTSANIARGAADVCHIDAAKIARFKTVTKRSYPEAPDFEGAWKLGYTEAQSMVDRLASLAVSNPAEHSKEVGEACPALSKGIDEAIQ